MTEPLPRHADGVTQGAGFWLRAFARTIDMGFGWSLGLVGGVLGCIVLAILQMAGRISPGWEQRAGGLSAVGFGLSLLGGLVYHTLCEGIHGATLGKMICRLRVLQEDGRPSTMKGAFVRSLGWYVDGLFFGLIGYATMQRSSLKQRYGVEWGKTVVMRTRDLPVSSTRSPLQFIAGLFLGTACWTLLLALGLVLKAA